MEKKYKIEVQLTTQDIFRFLLHHSWSTWQGKATWGLGIMALVGAPIMMFAVKDSFSAMIFLIVAIMYLVVSPFSLYSNAKRQMISNSVFKNKIIFTLSEDILLVKQYTGEVRLLWEQIEKIDINKNQYLLYVNKQQAFIIPKRFINQSFQAEVEDLIKAKQEKITLPHSTDTKSSSEEVVVDNNVEVDTVQDKITEKMAFLKSEKTDNLKEKNAVNSKEKNGRSKKNNRNRRNK